MAKWIIVAPLGLVRLIPDNSFLILKTWSNTHQDYGLPGTLVSPVHLELTSGMWTSRQLFLSMCFNAPKLSWKVLSPFLARSKNQGGRRNGFTHRCISEPKALFFLSIAISAVRAPDPVAMLYSKPKEDKRKMLALSLRVKDAGLAQWVKCLPCKPDNRIWSLEPTER